MKIKTVKVTCNETLKPMNQYIITIPFEFHLDVKAFGRKDEIEFLKSLEEMTKKYGVENDK